MLNVGTITSMTFQTVVFGGMWVFWNLNSGYSGCNDGLSSSTFSYPKRFYAVGNWSRFVRPGWLEISATSNPQTNVYVTAFKNTSTGAFAIVAVNAVIPTGSTAAAKSQTFNLSNLSTTTVTPWITDGTRNLIQQSAVSVSANSFSYTLPADSVTTFVGTASSGGGTINAASCSETDVQTAFNSVTSSTTTVNIPACSGSSWTSTVTLNVPASTNLKVVGQTVCPGDGRFNTLACTDNTSILDGMPNISGNPDNPVWAINVPSGSSLTVQGITLTGTGTSPVQTFAGAIQVNGSSQSIRFTQTHFVNMNQVTAGLGNTTAGVVDHSIWEQNQHASILFRTQAATSSDWAGQIPRSQTTNLGTLNQWYFEDDQLIAGSTDCDKGGRFAVRFNTFTAGTGTLQWLLTHPTGEPGGAIRGCRAWEAYDNNFVIPPSFGSVFALWFLYAGTGVTFDNTISPGSGSSLSVFFDFISERSNNNTYSQTAVPNGWGYCGTHFNGTGSVGTRIRIPSTAISA